VLRYAGSSLHRQRCSSLKLSSFHSGSRHSQKCAVSDEERMTIMFISKKHLSRRTFLHGAGVTIALPFLESMVPAQTPLARTAAAPTQRFGFFYVPHGSIMKDWTPTQDGAVFEFSPILKPLEKFRDQ